MRISLRPAGTEIVLVFCFATRVEEEEEEGEEVEVVCLLVSLDLLLIFRPSFSSDLPGTLRLCLFSLCRAGAISVVAGAGSHSLLLSGNIKLTAHH